MQHTIKLEDLVPQAEEMAHAIEACVHCGFCLPTCPTYVVMGEEMDSPRGRIFLMKEVLEGNLPLEEATPYLDNCLGCLACVTACPSGVEYGELITPFRAWSEPKRKRAPLEHLERLVVMETLPYPWRFRFAATLGRFGRPFRRFLPEGFGAMLGLLPDSLPKAPRLPEVFPAKGERRARVALLAGCAQQVLAPGINWATLKVLSENGVEVVLPPEQGCCGALAMHVGEAERAKAFARRNLAAFKLGEVDAIVSNAAGCGSGMKEYPLLFKGEREAAQAEAFAAKVTDVSVFLHELGLKPPPGFDKPMKLAYHDACHLAHAQGVRDAPRALLSQVPNLELLEPPEWELCCGSAGSYNIEKPEVASDLGARKARNILQTGAEAVASGNIGCLTQLQSHLRALGKPLPVWHTIEVLERAYHLA
jgi:glycolate oxidase iron-sulfur subunit